MQILVFFIIPGYVMTYEEINPNMHIYTINVLILTYLICSKIIFAGTASAGKVVCNRKRLAYSGLAIWTKRRSTVVLLTLFI